MNGIQIEQQTGETQLVFGSVLDIAGARNLYTKLQGVLAIPTTLVLDAGGVERVDTAALQLLATFCRATREAGMTLRWSAASPALCDAATLLGLNETLGKPT